MDQRLAISVREMASRLGISLPTAYELVKRDGFPKIMVGSKILIPIKQFEEWITRQVAV